MCEWVRVMKSEREEEFVGNNKSFLFPFPWWLLTSFVVHPLYYLYRGRQMYTMWLIFKLIWIKNWKIWYTIKLIVFCLWWTLLIMVHSSLDWFLQTSVNQMGTGARNGVIYCRLMLTVSADNQKKKVVVSWSYRVAWENLLIGVPNLSFHIVCIMVRRIIV